MLRPLKPSSASTSRPVSKYCSLVTTRDMRAPFCSFGQGGGTEQYPIVGSPGGRTGSTVAYAEKTLRYLLPAEIPSAHGCGRGTPRGMPRPRIHDPGTVLDAAESLAVRCGPAAVTTHAVAAATGVSNGAIYHTFGSRAELLGRTWLRAASWTCRPRSRKDPPCPRSTTTTRSPSSSSPRRRGSAHNWKVSRCGCT
nr:TetR family transcriptional regulator [Nocardia beijingensis]